MFVEMQQSLQKIQLFLIFVLAVCAVKSTLAQQYSFNYLTTKDGLSNSVVNCIYNDSRGYTWLGTEGGGLCRYDGKSMVVYGKEEGLVGNYLTCITEDKKGNIWIGTTEGASKFNGKSFTSYTKKNGLKSNSIFSIAEGLNGKIYLASNGGGITILAAKTISYLGKKEGLPTDTVYALAVDSKGVLWIGLGSRGAVSFNGKTVTRYTQFPELCRNTYFTLCCDSKDNIWLGSISGLLFKLNNLDLQKIELPAAFEGSFISNILEDKWGAVWIATAMGALKYTSGNLIQLNKINGLSNDDVRCFSSDKEGNVWIGTLSGVSIFTNKAITAFNEKNGFDNSNIYALLPLNDSALLVGTSGPGLYMVSANYISKIITNSPLDQSSILSLTKNNKEEIIIGTPAYGLFFLDKNFHFLRQIKELNGIELKSITQLLVDQNNNLFITAYGDGLFKVDSNGTSQWYFSKNSNLVSNDILCAHYSSDGKLLIGLFQNGLMEFDGINFNKTKLPFIKENSSINCIKSSKNGVYFIGTGEEGVILLDHKKSKKFTKKDGLCSNAIQCLYWDEKSKKLWLGTDKGVNLITLSSDNVAQKIDFIGEDKGLYNSEISRDCIRKTANGSIWIGTLSGLFNYDAKQEKTLGIIPTVLLNDVQLFNKETNWSKYSDSLNSWNKTPLYLNLNYNENQLLFKFSAPGAEKNRVYQYMIQGYDKEWSPAVRYNEAIYSSLPPGNNYEFKVRLVNPDGKTGTVTTFTFSISPPFWRTWWFYSLVGALILICLFSYIRFRERSLIKEKKHLEEKVVERTIELKDTNEKLSEAFTDIKDSINYAQRIQQAILPMESIIHQVLPDSFILFKPRDVVSGDFYWFGSVEKNGSTHHIIAAADCTGHGVPGAFMSMIGNTILSEIVIAKEIVDPSQILSLLHHGIRKALKQNLTTSRDGMDICLCSINLSNNKVRYAGANNPLWILRKDKEIEIIKANKCAIGGFTEDNQRFESHEVFLQKGEAVYLFTDGYSDQFGGEFGKKLTAKKFREAILQVADKTMSQQKFYLENYIDIWKGSEFQVDDILVIGIRI